MEEINEVRNNLLKKSVVLIGGSISSDTTTYVKACVANLITKGSPTITVLISSKGGESKEGYFIYDLLKAYGGNTTAIVCDHAYSIAVTILQACKVRQSLPHSQLLIHGTSSRFDTYELEDPDKLKKCIEKNRKAHSMNVAIIAERSGKTGEMVENAMKKDEDMTAQEALEFGLIDKIIEKFPVDFGTISGIPES